jgi:hypothetical protein
MSKSTMKALRARLNGEPAKMNPKKHPILSGAVPLVNYQAPHWRYGKAQG